MIPVKVRFPRGGFGYTKEGVYLDIHARHDGSEGGDGETPGLQTLISTLLGAFFEILPGLRE